MTRQKGRASTYERLVNLEFSAPRSQFSPLSPLTLPDLPNARPLLTPSPDSKSHGGSLRISPLPWGVSELVQPKSHSGSSRSSPLPWGVSELVQQATQLQQPKGWRTTFHMSEMHTRSADEAAAVAP